MCCIFTCCGWMVDLIQRLWVFMMSCCISTAVGTVMVTSSMSGIALGYNYSLAEYIQLKETNVSIYLKRGIFDDDVGDDMEWRRSGHHSRKGHLSDENLITGAPVDEETTSIRSGRRLDDSVFEADDQNKFEGSLMKLTARPVHLDTTKPLVTEDFEMSDINKKYPIGSMDHLKAIQSLIDSRRMAASGSTLTPLATYRSNDFLPYLPVNNNPLEPGNPDAQIRRRMEQSGANWPANVNPARLAVPDESVGSRDNWVIPKNPFLFNREQVPDYFVLSPTYPSAITVAPHLLRPKPTTRPDLEEGAVIFVTRPIALPSAHTLSTTEATSPEIVIEKESELPDIKMPLPVDADLPRKIDEIKSNENKLPKAEKSSEEEYEDEIKGLPVRRRRNAEVYNEPGKNANPINLKAYTINNNKNRDDNEKQIADEDTINLKSKRKQSLLDHLITTIKLNKPTLEEDTPNEILTPPKDTRGSFESKIVSSKYVSNDEVTRFNVKQTTVGKQELLRSIGNLNDNVGLFKKPALKFFVGFL